MRIEELVGSGVSAGYDTYLNTCDADDDEEFGHDGLIL